MTIPHYLAALAFCLAPSVLVVWSKAPAADAARAALWWLASKRPRRPGSGPWRPALRCGPCVAPWLALAPAAACGWITRDWFAAASLPVAASLSWWAALPAHQRTRGHAARKKCATC